ncbi:MAG: hypothetical protein ABI822_27580 [Bryobacteraceae bacterium]
MDPTLAAVLGISMRWLHIASVVILLGAFFYTWSTKTTLAPGFRTTLWIAMVTILGSGLYNFLTKASYPPGYQMWFGIKFLFALHVFAVTVVVNTGTQDAAKYQRRATGVVISGMIAVAIGSYLRWISLHAV